MLAKKWVSFALAAAFMLCAAPSARVARAEDTIKLGIHGAQTGDLAGYGIPALNAAKIVVDQVNAKGGVLGKKVEILQADDQCKPELATNAATKLISDGAIVAVGPTCSGATKAALPLYMDKKIVIISPSATAPELTQSGKYPYFFRTIPTDDAQARLGTDFVLEALDAKNIAILHDKGDYGKGYATFAKKAIEESGKANVVFFEGITPGGLDYSAPIQKIGRSGADTLLYGGYYPEASKLATVIKNKGLKLNFVSEDGVKTSNFLQLAGKEGEGVYASSNRDFSDLPMHKAAEAAHQKMFNAPSGQFFFTAFAATQALLNAVEKAGSTNPDTIAKALRTEYADTVLGKLRFDAHGDAEDVGFAMFKVVNGAYVDQKFRTQ